MTQILLVLSGVFLIVKKRIKVSDTRVLTRPNSVILGSVCLIGAALISALPSGNITYAVALYGTLVIIAILFALKGERIEAPEAAVQAQQTKRNGLIFLIALPIVLALAYYLATMLA